ncbi:ribosome recycling factor [Candidatus Daviesbacteria bacterium]|nr:ribosome recycling factor [Candidatus Daviesbacteria bacterium]
MDPTLTEPDQKIQSALDYFKADMSAIRAGRANPTLVENVSVEAYGSRMKLVEVGTISAPQPSLLTVQVWDASIVTNVIKAIQEANLGLNPSNEGNLVRLPIPPLTEERRQEYVKLLHQKMEDARVQIRQIRQDTRNGWKNQMDAGEFGEDELGRREKLLQDLIDKNMQEIDHLGKAREEELMQI